MTWAGSGRSPTDFAFTGQRQDSQTGLQYLRERYYAPWQGRFMTRDAWSGDAMRPMSFNPWLYVYANPINFTDPSGLCVGVITMRCDGGTPTNGAPIPPPPPPPPLFCTPNLVRAGEDCIPLSCPSYGSGMPPESPLDPAELTSWGKQAWEAYQAFRDTPGWWLEPINALALKPVLAIAINYERSDLFDLNNLAKPHEEEFIEAFGRSYWQKCQGNKCQIQNGYPSAVLLNFLGLTSFRNHNPANTPLTDHNFPKAFEITDRVLNPAGADAAWINGWYLNNPAHWGNLVSSNPLWFKNWVTYARDGRRADPHEGSDPHQILFSSGPGTGNTFYILTPAQAAAHCEQAPSCVLMTDANGPRPDWVLSSYDKP